MPTEQRTVTVHLCDHCGGDVYWDEQPSGTACFCCHKLFCFKCYIDKDIVVSYEDEIGSRGGCRGSYCQDCDALLRAQSTDTLHAAYLRIQNIQSEYKMMLEAFNSRAKLASENVKRCFQVRKLRN